MKRRRKYRVDPKKVAILVAAVVLVVIIAVCVIVFVACGKSYDADTSTLFVLDKGKVVTTDIENFDESKYSAEDLEKYLEETIDTYNEENGKDSVKKKEFSVKNNVATLILEYASADVYEDFYGVELFTGTVSEAMEAGYAFDLEFARVTSGKAESCAAGEITDQTELKVAIIKANTRVEVAGEIVYLSADNVAEYGKNWVSLKDNCNILEDAVEEVSESGTENVELTTEIDIMEDGVPVGETEESTEIIFDFGDEEEEDNTAVEYSEKYIYIIYK